MTEPSSLSASERAYRAVRDRIMEGSFPPGTMLGEATLAGDLGVSRTPVRTALARLQDEGWITIYPKRGALVQGLTERSVAELADARLVLETTGVKRASETQRARLADRLDAAIADQREACAAEDVRRFVALMLAFHRTFVEAGGNGVLLELYDRLSDRHSFVLFASGERLLSRCEEIIAEHEALVRHLRAGDAAGFAEALRDHISETGATPVAAFSVEGVTSRG